jgi:hypothetical protein
VKNNPSGLLRFLRSRNAFLAMAALGLVTAGSLRSASAQGYSPIFAAFGDMPYDAPVSNYPERSGNPGEKQDDATVLKWFILHTEKP